MPKVSLLEEDRILPIDVHDKAARPQGQAPVIG